MSELWLTRLTNISPRTLLMSCLLLVISASSFAFDGESAEHCGTADNIDYDVEVGKKYCVAGSYEHMILSIPNNNTDVTITTSGGEGELGLYAKEGIWAYRDDHHVASENEDTTEQELTINVNAGELFFLTQGRFEGVTLEISAAPGPEKEENPNSCGADTVDDYYVNVGEACISGRYKDMVLPISSDNTDVTISTSGGGGNLALYAHTESWASSDYYHQVSDSENTTEQAFTINADRGYVYILAEGEFEGVTVAIDTSPGAERESDDDSDSSDDESDNTPSTGSDDDDSTSTNDDDSTTTSTEPDDEDTTSTTDDEDDDSNSTSDDDSDNTPSDESDDSTSPTQGNGDDLLFEARFLGLEGDELIERIVDSTIDQISPVYSVSGDDAANLFAETKMLEIIEAIRERVPQYNGIDEQGIENLIYYLRASAYVRFWHPDDIPPYTSAVFDNIRVALAELFAKEEFWIVSSENGRVLSEALILVDSSRSTAQFIDVIIKVLDEYDEEWTAVRNMNIAANNIYFAILRASEDENLQTLFAQDQSILDALNDFQLRNRHLLGTNEEYLLINAVRELSRLFHIPEMFDRVKVLSKAMLDSSSRFDETKPIWLSVGSIVDFYDSSDCEYYGICGFALQVEIDALPFNYQCSDTLKIRAQHMYNDQGEWICGVLGQQESFFHSTLETGGQPVADDWNQSLELVIFDSSDDYQDYAGIIFNVGTNNGGIYLEGAPGQEGNQARFLAYEAEWMKPNFHVWNLQHEYVHYLDGRFNKYGDFANSLLVDLIWWSEGLGEYISKIEDNQRAIDLGMSQEFSLATIFTNTYSSGNDRVYRWGYLAVRFMFERHLSDVSVILGYLRNNELEEYEAVLDNISEVYEQEWREWLVSELSTSQSGIVQFGPNDEESQDSGSFGNWDGDALEGVSTDFSTCVADDIPYDQDAGGQLAVDDVRECVFSGRRIPSFAIPEPYRYADQLRIRATGGWGDVSILYLAGERPYGSNFALKSNEQGNNDELIIDLDDEHYWHYIALEGNFGGVKLEITPVQ